MQITADSGDIPRAELLAGLPASKLPVAPAASPEAVESAERRREQEILAMAQAGDERALRFIYERHERQVRGHLHRLLGADSEIDDLVQVVFSRAFAAIDRFEGKAAISTWLYRITVNTTQNLMRQRFRRERMQRALRLFDVGRGADRVHSGKLEARDEAQRILARLHPDLRQIFVLYHYQGLTLQEIADIVERPISTIGDRLTRARKQLRELVSED
ncbi:MAG: RNA polymerase sigma factor [Myxococcales bacterium]|nr:RNA polymerase sigma factor [Myxococcales bacterium]